TRRAWARAISPRAPDGRPVGFLKRSATVRRTLNSLGWTMAVALVVARTAGAVGLVRAQGGGGKVQPLSAQDILEIQALGAKYAYGLDTGADDGYYYANVFTADGTFGN